MNLDRLQRWMLAVVTHPESGEAGVQTAVTEHAGDLGVTPEKLEDLVPAGPELSGAERLGIYARMIWLRFLESMEDDFQGVRALVGAERFRGLVRAYLHARPSRSYTLFDLGASFAEWLRDEATDVPEREAAVDLARLERALLDVGQGPDAPRLDADALLAVPRERWPEVRFRLAPAHRLLELRHAATDHLAAVLRGEEPPPPERRPCRVCVHRTGWRARWTELTRAEHALLAALDGGAPLAEALAQAVAGAPAEGEALLADLEGTFRAWTASELLSGVEA